MAAGTIGSLTRDGTELIRSGPRPDFWRAPTDNDRGNDMPERCAPWKAASRSWSVTSAAVGRLGPAEVELRFEGSLPDVASTNLVTYTVLGSGDILVESAFVPGEVELPELPRFGMQLTVSGGFETVTWYGRGPQESYWDRKAGARVGVYRGTVDEQFVDYSEPQENGNRTDVRWMTLTNRDGSGLLVVGTPLFGFSAHHFTTDDLEAPSTATRWNAATISPSTSTWSRLASEGTTAGAHGLTASTRCGPSPTATRSGSGRSPHPTGRPLSSPA